MTEQNNASQAQTETISSPQETPHPAQSTLSNMSKRPIFIILSFILAIVLLELLSRGALFLKRTLFPIECRHPNEATCDLQPFQADQTAALITDPFTGYGWQPGYQGEWLTINSLGFRGPEISTHRPDNTLRVAIVGGSAALGVGVHDNETIEAYLEQELAARLGRRVEVINGAITSFNSSQELTHIFIHILPLNPDVVIVYDGRNDIYFGLSPRWEPHYTPSLRDRQRPMGRPYSRPFDQTPLGYFLSTNTAIGLATNRIGMIAGQARRASTVGSLAMHPEAAELYGHNLMRIVNLLESEHIVPVLVLQPSLAAGNKPLTQAELEYVEFARNEGYFDLLSENYSLASAALERAGQATGARVYDFTGVFDEYDGTAYLDEAHLNPIGNQIIAQRLADILEEILAGGLPLTCWER